MRESYGSEQRQHIMISYQADHVIREDSMNYYGEVNVSGCINRIIRNYSDTADASISKQIERMYDEYSSALSCIRKKDLSDSAKDKVIQALLSHETTRRKANTDPYPKDKAYKIRLQDDIWKCLYDSEGNWQEQDYYSSQGVYIKMLVEEYARLSPYEREAVFYKKTLEQLETEIHLPKVDRRIIKFSYKNASGKTIAYNVKAYKICADNAHQYHYLIGLSSPVRDTQKNYTIAAFRISRIQEDSIAPHAKSYGSGSITNIEQDNIENLLKSKGVQFLLGEDELIRIQLTPAGIVAFNSQYYLRPATTSISNIIPCNDGSAIYEFNCTRRQIEYYFFKFGEDARILSPLDLADQFKAKYQSAFERYETKLPVENVK